MATRMLIDATHPEETRVVVVKGTRLEEFDFETSTKRPLKGNIYLAKVTRVEPSLQAAFVEYGGNRHGFLAFGEIHPDYYQIPVADRRLLLQQQAAAEAAAEAEAEAADAAEAAAEEADAAAEAAVGTEALGAAGIAVASGAVDPTTEQMHGEFPDADRQPAGVDEGTGEGGEAADALGGSAGASGDIISVGGDVLDELAPRRAGPMRSYKIQEVIKRRQILLVQVVKEERGNKGAALTTYLSLAGRYCVLMPNSARGGGISRKIVSATDRKRLKSIASELDVPEGMGVILRTAGMDRLKSEIKRDFEYLLRLWDNVRELTLQSTAPCLVYEEGSLIKRAIRDYYSNEIEEILVEGEEAYRTAKDFMRMLMPSHAKKVQPYRERNHLFHRFQVDQQFDSMYSPTVQLKSGGYIVINSTEALVAIDVNSGKSTREHNIEETAYKTNLEAAEEIARQLRLRDLAGLIVIDFIDMEEGRNNRNVERRMKECLKHDRARIQVGRISAFGLLEMSRQRLRPSLLEASTQICEHCQGRGYIRSIESTALHVLRAVEDEGMRDRSGEITLNVATPVAIYLLNHKREAIREIEERYGMRVLIQGDDTLVPPAHRIERHKHRTAVPEIARPVNAESAEMDVEEQEKAEDVEETAAPARAEDADGGRKRRRRRRRRRGDGEAGDTEVGDAGVGDAEVGDAEVGDSETWSEAGAERDAVSVESESESESEDAAGGEAAARAEPGAGPEGEEAAGAEGEDDDAARKRRRRGRRGGRRRRREDGVEPGSQAGDAERAGAEVHAASGDGLVTDAWGAPEAPEAERPVSEGVPTAATEPGPETEYTRELPLQEPEQPNLRWAEFSAPPVRETAEPEAAEPEAPEIAESGSQPVPATDLPPDAAPAAEPWLEPRSAQPEAEQPEPAQIEAAPAEAGTPEAAETEAGTPESEEPAEAEPEAEAAQPEEQAPPSPPRRGWWRRNLGS